MNKLKEDPNYKETHDFDFNNKRWHFLQGKLYRGHFNDRRNQLTQSLDKETENQSLDTEDHYLALAFSVYFVGCSCFCALKLFS